MELQLQQQSFLWIFSVNFHLDGLVGSLCSPRNSQESLPTPQFKVSVLQCSAFFMVQLSYLYMTVGKTIALTIWTFVGKVMSLLLNMLSRFVIAFLPKSKHLLISWLQSLSTMMMETKKIKSVTLSSFSLSTCHEVMRPDDMKLAFLNVEFQASFFTLLFHPHQVTL